MNVEAVCPVCYASHVVPAGLRGKRHRCDGCEEVFIVHAKSKPTDKSPRRPSTVLPADAPSGAEEIFEAEAVEDVDDVRGTGRRRRRGQDRDRSGEKARRTRRPGGAPWGLVFAAVAVVLVFLGAVSGVAWLLMARPPARLQPPRVVVKTPVPNFFPADAPPQWPAPPDLEAPPAEPAKLDPPRPTIPTKPAPPRETAPPEAGVWRLTPDAATPFSLPLETARAPVTVESGGFNPLVLPALPSPFVALGGNRSPVDRRQVWDLRTMQPVGELGGGLDINDEADAPLALSPDGKHLAAVSRATGARGGTVDVWSVADKKMTRLEASASAVVWMEFTDPGHLLTCKPGSETKRLLQLWDIVGRRVERAFDGPADFRRETAALSAGGRTLAVATVDKVLVYDVKSGDLVGERTAPGSCAGLAFAPDGSALAGLFAAGSTTRVVAWDVANGGVTARHDVSGVRQAPRGARGRALQWLPDGSGWIVHGQTVLDRAAGAVLTSLPPDEGRPAIRFAVGADHFAVLAGQGGKRTFRVEAIAWEKLDAERKKK